MNKAIIVGVVLVAMLSGCGATAHYTAKDRVQKLASQKVKERAQTLNVAPHRQQTYSDASSPTAKQKPSVMPVGDFPGWYGNYHALLIGVQDYNEFPKLNTPRADILEIGKILKRNYGFEVSYLLNPTRGQIIKALTKYRRLLGKEDNLLLYYAGHGWLDEYAKTGYWLPRDAGPNDPSQWVSVDSVTRALRAMEAKNVLVVADSCYSGTLTRGVTVRPNIPNYHRKVAWKKSRLAMTSGGLEPVVDDGMGGDNSLFAEQFLTVLRDSNGIIDSTELFLSLRKNVAVNASQTPQFGDIRNCGHEGGDFVFVPPDLNRK